MLKSFSLVPFLVGSALVFVFIFFSFLVNKNVFTQMDFNTTVRLQDKIPHKADRAFSILSEIGSAEPMSVVVIVLLIGLVWRKKILAAISTAVCFFSFHVIELFGKTFVDQLPPPQFMLRTENLADFPQFHIRQEFSYPSGHSGRAFFISTILIILILQSKRFSFPVKIMLCGALLGYDVLMMVSRVYLGEHWTTDVIAGAIFGTGLGLITTAFLINKNSLFGKHGHEKGKGFLPKFKVKIERVE